jgi:mannan endo-1,4-beta-mannosidase
MEISFLRTLLLLTPLLLAPVLGLAQVDPLATSEAKVLYRKLFRVSRDFENGKILYGHQNGFHEGRGWRLQGNSDWSGALPESDLHKAFGKDPAVVGYDFAEIGNWNEDLIVNQMRAVHQRGGVVTMSWHIPNFDESGADSDAWNTSGNTVRKVVSDPHFQKLFRQRLDRLVAFLGRLKDVPIIFRPWHEHNYFWFWWGSTHCTPDEYKKIWRYTANYLKIKGVHQLLYAYSPNDIEKDYFERYPGDGFVDILGVDAYFKSMPENLYFFGISPLDEWKGDVVTLLNWADEHGKIPAITEFGNEGIVYSKFWTDYFSWPMERDGLRQFAKRMGIQTPRVKPAYSLLWRNDRDSPKHFYSPFPGAPENENFKELLGKGVLGFLGDF